jgi:hypothetical protein
MPLKLMSNCDQLLSTFCLLQVQSKEPTIDILHHSRFSHPPFSTATVCHDRSRRVADLKTYIRLDRARSTIGNFNCILLLLTEKRTNVHYIVHDFSLCYSHITSTRSFHLGRDMTYFYIFYGGTRALLVLLLYLRA